MSEKKGVGGGENQHYLLFLLTVPFSSPRSLTAGTSTRLSSDTRRRVDEATRKRRQQQQLAALEKDNFHDDPHAAFAHIKLTKLPTFSDGTESVESLILQRCNCGPYNLITILR